MVSLFSGERVFPCYIGLQTGWNTERARRDQRGRPPQTERGPFYKQGNLHRRTVLGSDKRSRSLHPPARILKVYIEPLGSVLYSPDGLNNTLFFQGYFLDIAASVGKLDRPYILRTGEWVRSLQLWVQLGVSWQSSPLSGFLQHASSASCTVSEVWEPLSSYTESFSNLTALDWLGITISVLPDVKTSHPQLYSYDLGTPSCAPTG